MIIEATWEDLSRFHSLTNENENFCQMLLFLEFRSQWNIIPILPSLPFSELVPIKYTLDFLFFYSESVFS